MKRISALLLALVLTLSVAAGATAADIRPLEPEHGEIDLTNGSFALGIKDVDKISNSGYFTASLWIADHYDAAQIESLTPGDTVLVNGKTWTVQEVVRHMADEPGLVDTYEIYTMEENDNYIVFLRETDGCYICETGDWTPVSPVGDVRIMLPLPDRFEYYSGEETEPFGMDAFLDDLESFGDAFVPYNTFCVFENGDLVRVSHKDYPQGPEVAPDDDVEVIEPA